MILRVPYDKVILYFLSQQEAYCPVFGNLLHTKLADKIAANIGELL